MSLQTLLLETSGLTTLCSLGPVPRRSSYEIHYYLDDAEVSSEAIGISYSSWPATSHTSPPPTDWIQLRAALLEGTGFTVPDGVNRARLSLLVTADATAGQVWFDTVELATTDDTEATAYKDFLTTSTFAKVRCEFTDSGVVRSNAMWARQDPADTNISATALAYYTSTIPDQIPAGMWGDTFAGWGDPNITWGMPRAVVAITVDPTGSSTVSGCCTLAGPGVPPRRA